MTSCDYEIIAFTETWLNSSVFNAELFTSRYSVFRTDRDFDSLGCSRGGGVLIAVDSKINSEEIRINLNGLTSIDLVAVRIFIGGKILYIFVIYIPPNTSITVYENIFEYFFSLKYIYNSDILILGDFNIPNFSLNVLNNHNLLLQNFLNFFELKQFNSIKNKNNRILDLVIAKNDCEVEKAIDVLLNEDLHHPALKILRPNIKNNGNKKQLNNEPIYNFRKANFAVLYDQLSLVNWNFLSEFEDVNDACESFYSTLEQIFEYCVPKTISKKHNYPPWYTADIINRIKHKAKLLNQYRTTKNTEYLIEFKILRKNIKNAVNKCYREYINDIECNICNEPNKFWSFVNSFKSDRGLPHYITYKNENFYELTDKSNAFADYFQESYEKPTNVKITRDVPYSNNILLIDKFNQHEVLNSINALKRKMTAGPDLIPAFILRDCSHIFVTPLTIIFNLSLSTRCFPTAWKNSKICPVLKKGSKFDINNYRPITIICNFAKVFEHLLHDHIYNHVKPNIITQQHGFMKGRSTTTNLFCMTQFLSQSLDAGVQTDVIYTDFSKAFDRLDHEILLHKLDLNGLSNDLLQFFKSYLSGRTQFVQYNGFKSHEITVESGVPQGSVLGPLFFNIFVNDINENLDCNSLLYADDMKLFANIRNSNDCLRLQSNLNRLNTWCMNNGLLLNAVKCNVLTFTKSSKGIMFNYEINNVSLTRPDMFKDLGVLFDSELSFIPHMNYMVQQSFKTLGFICRTGRVFTSTDTIKMLFNTFVRSKLEYACVIWSPGYEVHVRNIENIQRRLMKFLSFKTDGFYPAIGTPQDQLLERWSLKSLQHRRNYCMCMFLFNIVNSKIDCPEILDLVNFRVPSVSTRNRATFYLPSARTNAMNFSPLSRICHNFDSLCSGIDIFHTSCNILKSFLLS